MTAGVASTSEAYHQIENDEQPPEEKREPTENQESATSTTPVSEPRSNEERGNPEEQRRAEQWKIRREWLTIIGLFLAAGAAIYQGRVLSKQADTLNGQLLEMKNAGIQADKLIQSNADLAAAAKSQANAEQQTAATAHDTLIADVRARISAGNVSLNPMQAGQPVTASIAYANMGKEAAPVDPTFRMKRWTKTDWEAGLAGRDAQSAIAACLAMNEIHGANIAYPSSGFGSMYSNQVRSDDVMVPPTNRFVADDDLLKGDAVIEISSCYPYRTLSETHHTVACYFYQANKTPNVANLNICNFGNAAD